MIGARKLREPDVSQWVGVLQQAGDLYSTAHELHRALDILAERVAELPLSPLVGVFLRSTGSGDLYMAAQRGMAKILTSVREAGHLKAWAAHTAEVGEPQSTSDFATLDSPHAPPPALRSCFFTPIAPGREVLGVLCIGYGSPHQFSPEESRLHHLLARVIGMTVERDHLRQEMEQRQDLLQRRNQEVQSLNLLLQKNLSGRFELEQEAQEILQEYETKEQLPLRTVSYLRRLIEHLQASVAA